MDRPPPPVQMVQLLAGFQVSQALYSAAKLGIPDQLAQGPRSAADVARVLQTHPQATARLLRALTALGVFASAGSPDRFAIVCTLADPAVVVNRLRATLGTRRRAR